jgi:hypothetical protein
MMAKTCKLFADGDNRSTLDAAKIRNILAEQANLIGEEQKLHRDWASAMDFHKLEFKEPNRAAYTANRLPN